MADDAAHHTHHHHHTHPHAHEHAEPTAEIDYASANEAHFDAQALEFDTRPDVQGLAKRVSEAMRQTYPQLFNKKETKVLDFACGSGVLSRELIPYVKSILGVDISQKMVDLYNFRANQIGIPSEEMRAIRAVLTGDGTELDGARFDVIFCATAYHHFPDTNAMTRMLCTFLKPGGSLLVVDIVNESDPARDPSEPELLDRYKHIAPHQSGFTELEIRATLEGAGLVDFEFGPASQAMLHNKEIKFFLAKGVKAQ